MEFGEFGGDALLDVEVEGFGAGGVCLFRCMRLARLFLVAVLM